MITETVGNDGSNRPGCSPGSPLQAEAAGISPVAWAVNHAHGTTIWDSETKARKVADEWLASGVWVWAEVVALYPQPQITLTDAEREALEYAAAFIHDKGLHRQSPSMVADAATIRQLMRRMTL